MTQIFVLCPDWAKPSGGVKKLYRHVEVLNSSGISAAIVHQEPAFRPTWMQSSAPIMYESEINPAESDFMLVPEVAGLHVMRMEKWQGIRKVIFNQGAYQTFQEHSFFPDDKETPYRHGDFVGVITVSEDSKNYLEFAFPGLLVVRIHNSIDASLFYPDRTKRRQIALMPRRNGKDALQVINMLKFRESLAGFNLGIIYDLPEVETARVLRESLLFLNFGAAEGSPLPPAEAMACACLVIGYDGRGGREFITPKYAFPIETGDIVGFAATVEKVLRQLNTDPQPLREKAKQASEFILSTYTPEREAADILEAWRRLAGVAPP